MRRLLNLGAAALVLAGGLAASSAGAQPGPGYWQGPPPVPYHAPRVFVPVGVHYAPSPLMIAPDPGGDYPPAYGQDGGCYGRHRVWSWRRDEEVRMTRARPC